MKVTFYDKEQEIFAEAPISIVRMFREYMNIPQAPGFADFDNTPQPKRYVPFRFTDMLDDNNVEIWESDIIEVRSELGVVLFKVVYESELACYSGESIGEPMNQKGPLFMLREMSEKGSFKVVMSKIPDYVKGGNQ